MTYINNEIIPGLFRSEFRKVATVLCKYLGIEHLDTAEDITSETFLLALETWPYTGLPPNPTAWLYTVAKNKTLNFIKRKQTFEGTVVSAWKQQLPGTDSPEPDLSDQNIFDSQLQMLFAICHPSISVESQISLALRILCGFGIDEIATAFLVNRETVIKRLQRAKQKLRAENIVISLPSDDKLSLRLDAVLTTLYLLFNEGYYSETDEDVIRPELAVEAMRLLYSLIQNTTTSNTKVKALFALMCFQSSRFGARISSYGSLILYDDQDETKWDQELIARGAYWLHEAANGESLSSFHIEATIAYWHTVKNDSDNKWINILDLYDKLLAVNPTPATALNRIYALYKVKGRIEALREAQKLNADNNRFYHALLTELYDNYDLSLAGKHLAKALTLTNAASEKAALKSRYAQLLTYAG